MFDPNVLGTLLGLKHELRIMPAQGSGSIVNISSTFGERGGANFSLYAGSKHAVEGITKSAAIEAAAYGVRVNAVAPGPTETAMLDRLTGSAEKKAAFYSAVPLKRGASPGEIADAIVFVASGRANLHHRADHSRERWQDGQLIAGRRRTQATQALMQRPNR
jgi:NAD(P)-dependent dehydrogenase (short-subunit alcohol dehydrogenase family)